MSTDYLDLMWDESTDLAALLRELDDASFDHGSLCEGWRVRDVVSHMLVGHTLPMGQMMGKMLKYRGNVPKGSFELSIAYGTEHTPQQIRDAWTSVTTERTRRGISTVIPKHEGFVDHLIHHQDIRRPLGLPREIPAERLTAALDALPKIGGFLKSKQRMKGLRWRATDIDWTWGEGLELSGPAEALILSASGRTVALGELSGPGVDALSGRLAAA